MESFYFCWTGSDITIHQFEGQGDMVVCVVAALLQWCLLTCKFCWVQFWHSSQEVRMGEIVYERHVGKGATEDDKPYLGWHCSLFNVMCTFFTWQFQYELHFSLHTSKHEVLHAAQDRWLVDIRILRLRSLAPGQGPHHQLPGIRATRLHLDASWFFVQHVPWQFFISLVLLRHHKNREKEAADIGAEIIFFNPGFKSQQMNRILVWEVACRHQLWWCLNLSHICSLQWCCLSHLLHLDHSRMRDLANRVKEGNFDLLWVHCNSGCHRAPQVAAYLRAMSCEITYAVADTWMN